MLWNEEQIKLMVTYLIHLQFYSDEDELLFSRDKKSSIHIPGIRPVIAKFVSDLLRPIDNIRTESYRKYLTEISKIIPIDIDLIEIEFNNNISQLPKDQRTPELMVNFLVGPIRSALQNHEFEVLMNQIQMLAIRKYGKSEKIETIDMRLKEAYSRNEESVALLYNLVFLRYLVKFYGYEELYNRVNDIVFYYQEKLVNRLINM